MSKSFICEGQINMFDLPEETKEEVKIDKPKIAIKPIEGLNKIVNMYKDSCTRIIKSSNTVIVGLADKSLYFNSKGEHKSELNLKPDIELLPADEIIIVNKDSKINKKQLEILESIAPEKYIKRKGDCNLIIPYEDKTVVINPKGWVLDYKQKTNYKENELFEYKTSTKETKMDTKVAEMDTEDINIKIGDPVEFEYSGERHKGNIYSIYNNGQTVNVSWNNKIAPFYIGAIEKIREI